MAKPPLGLPEGSVRAIIALLIVVTVCGMCVCGRPIPELMGQAFLLAIGIYGMARALAPERVTIPADPPAGP